MDPIHLHLLLNHIPVLGSVMIVVLLLVSWRWRNPGVKQLVLWLTFAISLSSLPALLTGDPAEEALEQAVELPRETHRLIHEHEEMGEKGAIVMDVVGLLALVSLWQLRRKGKVSQGLWIGMVVAATCTVSLMAYTAYLGGFIRHPEIHSEVPQVVPSAVPEK